VPGGVQAQVLGLAGALRAVGHEAVVVAPYDGRRSEPDGIIAVGRSIRIPVNGSIAAMAPLPGPMARTVQYLRRGKFDVVHLHEPLAASITLAALVGRVAPVVGTFHAAGDRTPYRWAGPLLKPLALRIDRRVAVSEPAKQLAHRYLGGTYEVLFNGVDLGRFASGTAVVIDRPTILFLGRDEPRKGLRFLLEAMAYLPADVRLRIAGAGHRNRALHRRYSDDRRIEWLGELDENDKIAHLRAASVLCVPSLHGESFGVTLIEAMATKTPVVASDLPGYRQPAAGGAALLVPPGDARQLAASLLTVLRDQALADRLRELGRQRSQQFGIELLAKSYISIYRTIA
jgi:phosphatidylinositol alpha-mannosyltransferase